MSRSVLLCEFDIVNAAAWHEFVHADVVSKVEVAVVCNSARLLLISKSEIKACQNMLLWCHTCVCLKLGAVKERLLTPSCHLMPPHTIAVTSLVCEKLIACLFAASFERGGQSLLFVILHSCCMWAAASGLHARGSP